MNEHEAKRLFSVLAWATRYHTIPNTVSDQSGQSLSCVGFVSRSEIRISIGNIFVSVDRDRHHGIIGNPKSQSNYGQTNDGARLEFNLNEDNQIITGCVLSGGPDGEIEVSVSAAKAVVQLAGTSTEFLFS